MLSIQEAAQKLSQGGIVGIPTETVYGLAADALNVDAVTKVFEAKNRPSFDPLICHVDRVEAMQALTCEPLSQAVRDLVEAFCPGPLTIILPKAEHVPDLVTAGLDTVGIRIPDHPMTLELLRTLGKPLAAPSANPFGYVSPTTAEHVVQQLGDRIDGVMDGGACRVGLESTIVAYQKGRWTVLRLGGLELKQLETILGPVEVKLSSSQPKAPGQLSSHYSPGRNIALRDHGHNWSHETRQPGDTWISWDITAGCDLALSPDGSTQSAAQHLFQMLRDLDNGQDGRVLIEKAPDVDLGPAINDRLTRSAHPA